MLLLIPAFLAYGTAQRNYSPHTRKNYKSGLAAFARHLDSLAVDALAVTPAQIADYDKGRSRHLRPASRRQALNAIKSFYRWLHETGQIPKNPAARIKMPEMDRSSRTFPLGLVRARLIEASGRLPSRGVLAQAVMGAMFHGGLRPAEVCSLEIGDVHFHPADPYLTASAPYLHVRQGKGNKERDVPLSDDLVAWFGAWAEARRPGGERFFTRDVHPLTQYVLRGMFRQVKAVAGVKDSRMTPHSLRHSCATTLYEAGVDLPVIQEILGHGQLETTRRYVHPTDTRKFSAVQKLNLGTVLPAAPARKIKPVRLLRRMG